MTECVGEQPRLHIDRRGVLARSHHAIQPPLLPHVITEIDEVYAMNQPIRVAIVEDHVLLAQTVGLALRAEGIEAVHGDLSGEAALLASLSPDPGLLVILDLDLG